MGKKVNQLTEFMAARLRNIRNLKKPASRVFRWVTDGTREGRGLRRQLVPLEEQRKEARAVTNRLRARRRRSERL